MKKYKILFKIIIALLVFSACTDEERDLSFLDNVQPPSNLGIIFNITQDNTGLVTISPTADGAQEIEVYFGDGTNNSATLINGESVQRNYSEGTFDVRIVAKNAIGDSTEATQQLVVSFKAPQNLVVALENDASVSKQVNITANAEFATMYDFYSGENGAAPISANIGETISYQYQNAGDYSIRVVAKGGAIATTEYTEVFTVTEILAPIEAAPTPRNRIATDVVSIFSDAYTDVTLDELPTSWSQGNFEAISLNNDNVWKLTSLDFLGIVTNYANGENVSTMETLHIDYWVPDGTTNELFVKIVNTIDGGEAQASLGSTVGGSWQSVDIDITEFDNGNLPNKEKITQILIDSDGISSVVYIDNFYFYKAPAAAPFNDGLLTNGDFEAGSNPWIVGVDDNAPAPVVTNGGNTYYSTNVTNANPSQPFLVNVSQKLEIVQGNSYTLTFDAWSDVNRSIIAGIGLSGGNFANDSKPVAISTVRETYTLTLSSANFGATDARVLFDLNGENGMVNIDNVSLNIVKDNLLVNGDFEAGSNPWIVGVDDNAPAPVVTDNGNTFYSVTVTNANPNEPFQVNVSQKLEIIQGETYTLIFDAWSDRDRSIIGGIGLSGGNFSNDSKSVDITSTRTTYTLTLSSANFGTSDSRVLFDLNGENGLVNIDNVCLSKN